MLRDEGKGEAATVETLVFILGDQLSHSISSLDGFNSASDAILMCEVMAEATYVGHHKKKIAFIFSSMRHFAQELRDRGYHVRYVTIDDPANSGSFDGELRRAVSDMCPKSIQLTEPGEWRVHEIVCGWQASLNTPVKIVEDKRFICSKAEFAAWAAGRKTFVMEFFYREMRRKTGLLMQGDEPVGGKWNFDTENRRPANPDMFRPERRVTSQDAVTDEVIGIVGRLFPDNFGELNDFNFAVTSSEAIRISDDFLRNHLAEFGSTQDAMLADDPFLNHSLLSFYINVGFIDPLDLCRRAESAYLDGRAPLNSVEGFIRQIIGWREYMRGIYWLSMRAYREMNFFNSERPLPAFYWSGETDMNCVATVVRETRANAYAHHIQRLMITGNFALIAGVDPRQVHEWYLEVYADAYEWVEVPNVIGMSQFADGGIVGTKPYAASGKYISHMSDYCANCRFSVEKRTGDDACPFNFLYWDFLARNRNRLSVNRRLSRQYANWDRMYEADRVEIIESAARYLSKLSQPEGV
ncbi:deoxyribodipyrimidine photo-lyase-related protein (plasmid) [Rhizobium tropici CIAT 899]|uniref:cryptochrome/photolyase family protein n=1 Tax=Rhizobium sp. SEMIA 4088 TaxID=2137763 RepID=UPI0002A719CF|nr:MULTISPECIES: cryptochrome/photolyase family protein [Rhizobium]AGB73189.1 deoxyribodipyrimidine photo-lyase-related protein [Rhizobium tropici CIAT 899]